MRILTKKRGPRANCRTGMAAGIFVAGVLFSITSSTWAGSIFDDDYVPPKRVEPTPTPSDTPAPTNPSDAPTPSPDRPTNVPSPAPTKVVESARRSVPDRASRAKCRKLFEEVYAAELKDHAPVARRRLAVKLLAEAGKTEEGSADRFMLLNGAIQAGKEGRSLRICFSAAKRLATEFDADELAAKADAASSFSSGPVSSERASVSNVETLMGLADELVAEDLFSNVAPVESALQKLLPEISDADLKAEIKSQIGEVSTARDALKRAAPSIEKLKQSPDDPAANLAAGRYFCFLRGQWDKGLPLLNKSSDAQLKDIAAAELSHPATTGEMSQLADRWSAEALKLPPSERTMVQQHAASLLRTAAENASGLEKLSIEKRLARAASTARMRRVDLLDLFDPNASVVVGDWRMHDSALVAAPSTWARAYFDYEPPAEYDFKVKVSVVKARDGIVLFGYSSAHQFIFVFGGWGNEISAFEKVDGAGGSANKTSKHKSSWVTAGKQYEIVLKVRRTGVDAYADGQLISGLVTDFSNLDLDGNWRLPKPNVVGLGIQQGSARFDSAQIVEVSGEGKFLADK